MFFCFVFVLFAKAKYEKWATYLWQKVENEMEQPTPARMGNKFLSSIACLFSFFQRYRDLCKLWQCMNGCWHCFALRLVCGSVCVCTNSDKKKNSCVYWFVHHITPSRAFKTAKLVNRVLEQWSGRELGMFGARIHSNQWKRCWIWWKVNWGLHSITRLMN